MSSRRKSADCALRKLLHNEKECKIEQNIQEMMTALLLIGGMPDSDNIEPGSNEAEDIEKQNAINRNRRRREEERRQRERNKQRRSRNDEIRRTRTRYRRRAPDDDDPNEIV